MPASSTPDDMVEPAPVEELARGPEEEKRTRVVEVRVLSAQNLPRMDAFGKCDAFCRLTFGGEPRETSVLRWERTCASASGNMRRNQGKPAQS